MRLRLKIYLIVGLTLLTAVAMTFLVSQTVYMRGFTSIERAEMREQVARAKATIAWNLSELGAAVRSYSSQDDTLIFLQTADRSLPESTFNRSYFAGFGLNVVAILDKKGAVVWGRGFAPEGSELTPLPGGLARELSGGGPLGEGLRIDQDNSGILMLPRGPLLIESRSVREGPQGRVQGAFLMGRWLDDATLAELGGQTRSDLALLPISAPGLPAEVREAAASSSAAPAALVIPRDTRTLAGYTVLRDVFEQPALVMQVETPRAIWAQGAASVRNFMISLITLVLVFGPVIYLLLERLLFRRLTGITAQVRHMRPGRGRLAPVKVGGHDELDLLAETINNGFSQLEATRTRQEAQARSLASTLDELKVRHIDLEKAHRRLQQLQHVSDSLGSSLEIKDALAQIETVALDVFEADEIWLLRLRPEEGQLAGLGAFFRSKPGHARLPRLFGCDQAATGLPQQANRLLKAAFQSPDAVFIDSAGEMTADDRRRLFGGTLPDLDGFRSLALVPLVADDAPVGVAISASAAPGPFTADRRSTILLFAGQVAQALKNTRLVEEIKALGEIDSLSGLYNRRRALEQLEMEIRRAERYDGRFSVFIADIDNFKLFNDTYGHPVGDEIIRRVAGLLRYRSRSSDFVARFGGDEFVLILPEAYRADAKRVADHMRAALASLPYIAPDGTRIPLRMSFGASAYPEDGLDAASLIAVADANLYESKRWGGDTVTVRPEPINGETVDSRAFSTLDSLVSAVDNKDHYTRRHSAQVAEHAAALAVRLGLTSGEQESLHVAALLHDVGKIGVPDRILRKPGRLTPKEMDYMRQHPLIGGMMISQHLPENLDVKEAVTSHHERWDGTGYPAQLRGPEIPRMARILAVADAYSAMTSDRPYHAALGPEEAALKLREASGTQFDPEVVEAFMASRGLLDLAAQVPGLVDSLKLS